MNRANGGDGHIKSVRELVDICRHRLLDRTRKSGLISFKHSERSLQHIRVINEQPNFLYKAFIGGKELTFSALPDSALPEDEIPSDEKTPEFRRYLEQEERTNFNFLEAMDSINKDEEGAPEKIEQIKRELRNKIREDLGLPPWKEQKSLTNSEIAEKHGLNPSYEMPKPRPENQGGAGQRRDGFIQTLLLPKEMDRKLRGLHSCICSDIQESGVNTLYAAFGFLEWYEDENSDKECLSPLLLLPLEIKKEKSGGGYKYRVRATGEGAEINLSLSERFRKDFGIELPTPTREEEESSGDEKGPESYMRSAGELIKKAPVPKKEKWKIRRFITIGRFQFARLVMYHDLGAKNWPGGEVSTNGILQSLFTGSDGYYPEDRYPEDYLIDTPEVEKAVPLLITAADASQHSALVDVMKGKNLVIQGPPGTGKSQTITNIIANALATGKSVLFLAEKMAALNVVHERLRSANLGPYRLELHSKKANKTEFLNSVKERLELCPETRNDEFPAEKLDDFKRYRDRITKYLAALNGNFGRQNRPIYDYLWGMQRHKERVSNLLPIIGSVKIPFEQADLTESELRTHTDELQRIAKLREDIDKECEDGKHPWEFIDAANLKQFERDSLRELVEKWRDSLREAQSQLEAFNKDFDLSIDNATQAIGALHAALKNLFAYDAGELDEEVIASLSDKREAAALVGVVKDVRAYRSVLNEIRYLKNPSEAIDHIEEIEEHIRIAGGLGVRDRPALDIRAQVEDTKEERKLWDNYLERLLDIGKTLGLSRNEELDKIRELAEALVYISSLPRDYLLFRTNDIVDETNAPLLKAAADRQERIQLSLDEQGADYDLSMMGPLHEIRAHADVLDSASFFAVFNSSYRQAKKFFKLTSKQKTKFDPKQAASRLRSVADAKEGKEKIEQDKQLQVLCGPFFKGMETDFRKLQQTNERATAVRKRCASGNEFSRNVCQWLLKGDAKQLDSARDLGGDDHFIALKKKWQTSSLGFLLTPLSRSTWRA